MNGPFYWKARKGWYVKEVDAQQRRTNRRLAATKKEAFEIWKTEEAAKRPDSVKLETIVSKYLLWADRQASIGALNPVTVESYEWYLLRLLDRLPDQWVDELKPHHLADWIADSGWGAAGERNAISAIKRALNWAVEQGLITTNPIAKMKRPATPRRSVVVEAEIHKQLMEAVTDVKSNGRIDRQFRLVLVAVKHCGGRPQDVARSSRVRRRGGRDLVAAGAQEGASDRPAENRLPVALPANRHSDRHARPDRRAAVSIAGRGVDHQRDHLPHATTARSAQPARRNGRLQLPAHLYHRRPAERRRRRHSGGANRDQPRDDPAALRPSGKAAKKRVRSQIGNLGHFR
ncbi:hypothetical protein [Candidatus Laterigemmans baculatus]|nr:hypothetical protein [Candidatus Laterigemmans baculatus]